MNNLPDHGDGACLDLMRFSAGGVEFCADTDQIENVAIFDGTVSDKLIWLCDELGCTDATDTGAAVVFTVKTETGKSYQVVVDRMEDIFPVAGKDILSFPALLEPFALKKGLWGVVFNEGRIMLLIDFLLLMRRKTSAWEGLSEAAMTCTIPQDTLIPGS